MDKIVKIISIAILICMTPFLVEVSAFADSDMKNTISSFDVNVRINTDGSLDVTEKVKFTSFGGNNNTMLLIDEQEGEEVEVKNVYMLQRDGYIECDRLSAGQWDANVFSGTYSATHEVKLVRVKVYGNFSKRYGSIVVQYHVKNAVKRYNDVAEYKRSHIFKNWDGRISNINISVYLPSYTDTTVIHPFLHGVLVGKKKVESRRVVTFNIPDTVHGEYVETRIVFPQDMIFKAQYTDLDDHLDTIIQEEAEYNESDKADLLRARENAAKEAGRRAWAEKMTQQAKFISAILSILASLLGLYTIWKTQKKLHQLKKTPIPLDLKGIEQLSPAEVSLLISNGKISARAMLGSLLRLVSWGYLKLGVLEENNSRYIMTFSISNKQNDGTFSRSDGYLLEIVAKHTDETGGLNPRVILNKAKKIASAKNIRTIHIEWEKLILEDYSDKNKLETGLLLYRNVGLIFGSILFFLGCIIPVYLSIWTGYSMLIVGLALFLYSLRIRKHTDYGVSQYRIWKELKQRILNHTIALDGLPEWMSEPFALLGYSIALGTEKELGLFKIALNKGNNDLFKSINVKKNDELESMIKETITVLDKALSSVNDAL